VSIRERRAFWSSRPSAVLALALFADGCVGLLIGARGLGELAPLPLAQTAWVVGYAFVCSLVVNDLVKLLLLAGHPHVAPGQVSRREVLRGR
jgi:H+-transporting ATPase